MRTRLAPALRTLGWPLVWVLAAAPLAACGDEEVAPGADAGDADGSGGDTDGGDVGDGGGGHDTGGTGDASDGGGADDGGAEDAPGDTAGDADTTDAGDAADVQRPDVPRGDVPRVGECGDGIVDLDEECDDGNETDDDACTNACFLSFCGDGVINATPSERTFTEPIVTWFEAQTGYVCDDGASCPATTAPTTCTVVDNPQASEHGVCQALGFDRAVEVTWGGGAGGNSTPMLKALNWECWDFFCLESPFADFTTSCATREMLASIACEGIIREECDDGEANGNRADACRPTCRRPRCGDGVVDSGEQCDDGDRDDANSCSNTCTLPRCGDGIVNGFDECDDGNGDDLDGCTNVCRRPRCGDGILSTYQRSQTFPSPSVRGPTGAVGRVCDDGGSCEGRACSVAANGSAPEHGICQALGLERAVNVTWGGGAGDSDPRMPHAHNWRCIDYVCGPSGNTYDGDNCGTGEMLNSIECFGGYDEECDEGAANSNLPDATCRRDCTLPRCGDSVVDGSEACDDGNTNDADGCTNRCTRPVCGDSVRQLGEECDDGNDRDTDACRNDCSTHRCGDGFLADAEACDEGEANSDAPDSLCRANCTLPRCGDGIVDSGEACDDGNTNDADMCLRGCVPARCGDGVVQRDLGEQCDDANGDDSDGCLASCRTAPTTFAACADRDLESDVGNAVATGTTAGRVSRYTASCGRNSGGGDLAFNWVAPATRRYRVSLLGSSYDSLVHVRRFTAGSATNRCDQSPEIACNDDADGDQARVSFDATAGTAYLIVVDGASDASGDFVVSIVAQ